MVYLDIAIKTPTGVDGMTVEFRTVSELILWKGSIKDGRVEYKGKEYEIIGQPMRSKKTAYMGGI